MFLLKALVTFFVTAAVIYLSARFMKKVHIKSFGSAVIVALLIAVFNFLIGWLLRFVFHLATFGILYFTGLSIVISIVVNAIIIEIVDQVMKGFDTDGFLPSLLLAVILAVANGIVGALLF